MVISIGERIKSLRNERNMTLAELSQQTGLSTSYLSQLERDKTSPSIVSLLEIAKALTVNLRYFFEEEPDNSLAHVTRKSLAKLYDIDQLNSVSVALTPVDQPSRLKVWQYTLSKGMSISNEFEEEGEVFCLVLEGELTLDIHAQKILLKEGDSAAFEANYPHTLSNKSKDVCILLYAHATMHPMHKTQSGVPSIEKEVKGENKGDES